MMSNLTNQASASYRDHPLFDNAKRGNSIKARIMHNVYGYIRRKSKNVINKSGHKVETTLTATSEALAIEDVIAQTNVEKFNLKHIKGKRKMKVAEDISSISEESRKKLLEGCVSTHGEFDMAGERSDQQTGKHNEKNVVEITQELEEPVYVDRVPLQEEIDTYNVKVSNRFDSLRTEIKELAELQTDSDGCLEIVRKPRSLRHTTLSVVGEQKESSMQTDAVCEVNMAVEDEFNLGDQELTQIPVRKTINKLVKKKKVFRTYSRLLNYLRCKFFLKYRDGSLMQQMAHEARVWLIKAGHQCDSAIDYDVLSTAVTVAFLVTSNELEFRQSIKNPQNYDNMRHLNATVSGDLGRVGNTSVLKHQKLGGSLLGGLLPKMKLERQQVVA